MCCLVTGGTFTPETFSIACTNVTYENTNIPTCQSPSCDSKTIQQELDNVESYINSVFAELSISCKADIKPSAAIRAGWGTFVLALAVIIGYVATF